MISQEIIITNKEGIDTRTASKLTKLAESFQGHIQIVKGNRSADCKSLINILAMGIGMGNKITLHVEGKEEEACLTDFVNFFIYL